MVKNISVKKFQISSFQSNTLPIYQYQICTSNPSPVSAHLLLKHPVHSRQGRRNWVGQVGHGPRIFKRTSKYICLIYPVSCSQSKGNGPESRGGVGNFVAGMHQIARKLFQIS